jgi:hypothetical protein
MNYTIDAEQFVPLEIEAATVAEAEKIGREYIQDAYWKGVEPHYLEYTVTEPGGTVHHFEAEVNAEEPEPPCRVRRGHQWKEVDETYINLGRIQTQHVCKRCGKFRTITTESMPGYEPRTPACVAFSKPEED